jgi:hypothetical protein
MKLNCVAALAGMMTATLLAGCQQKRAQRPDPPPVTRSATTAYNTSELPPAATRTDARAFPAARIEQIGLQVGPTPADRTEPVTVDMMQAP